ncbi:MAG: hypothetical protein U0T83_03720 [Bacteriovoracaceae bacterium]
MKIITLLVMMTLVGCVQIAKESLCLATSLKCDKAKKDSAPSNPLRVKKGLEPLSSDFRTFPHTFTMLLWPNVEDVANWELKDLFTVNTKSSEKLEIIAEKVTESGTVYDQISKEMLAVEAEKEPVAKSQKTILSKYKCKPSGLMNIGGCFDPNPDSMDEVDATAPEIFAENCDKMKELFTPKELESEVYTAFMQELDSCYAIDKELKAYDLRSKEFQDKREALIKEIELALGKYDYKTNNFISTEYGSSEVIFGQDGKVKMNLRIQTTPGAEYLIYTTEGKDADIIIDNGMEVVNGTHTLKIKILERTVKGDRTGVIFVADLKGNVTNIGLRYLGDMEKIYNGKVIQKGIMKLIFPPNAK